MLAQTASGLSCFLLERGPGMEFQRLKDKLGTRSLPSSEVEFRGAAARMLGDEGRGVATIIEMVTHTRLDCVIGSAAGMRRGVAEAVWHARHRSAFGARLYEQPLMRNVLADLALESEAATATALRLARSYDEGDGTFRRFATAVLKYWICKRATPHAAEALECLGGNGYVEESPMPRLLRDSPLNGIWEGSGNVMSLDVLRAMAREPEGLPAFLAECELARGADARLDAHLDALPATLGALAGEDAQWLARRAVEDLALAFQASLLVRTRRPRWPTRSAPAGSATARGRAYGTLPGGDRARARSWTAPSPSDCTSERVPVAPVGDPAPELRGLRVREPEVDPGPHAGVDDVVAQLREAVNVRVTVPGDAGRWRGAAERRGVAAVEVLQRLGDRAAAGPRARTGGRGRAAPRSATSRSCPPPSRRCRRSRPRGSR